MKNIPIVISYGSILIISSFLLSGCFFNGTQYTRQEEQKNMITQNQDAKHSGKFILAVRELTSANSVEEEESKLGDLLTIARETNVEYGYQVYDETIGNEISSSEVQDYLDDKLKVTILVGSRAPYEEFVWYPKWNGHITRLIMP